jgi:cyclophilin family peptidyl-prolyl cis-trans isomerase
MNRAFARLAIVLAGIVATGIAAPVVQAGTVVRLDFDYSVNTTAGPLSYVEIELFDSTAPITVANFLQYVKGGHYDGTILHRSIDDFVVQGGGFAPTVVQGTVQSLDPIVNFGTIQNEYSPTRSNVAGTIAMAKVGDDPNSATNQWFFNVADNSANLDVQNGGFTVFGRVLGNGMELINAINALPPTNLTQYYGATFNEVPMANNGTSFITLTSAAIVPQGSLSGFVYVDSNLDGVMDGTDYIIAGAKVSLVKNDSTVATVYSNADGSYSFGSLGEGTYSIRMETPTYVPGQGSNGSQIVLDRDGNLVSSGSAGTVVQNSFTNIALGQDEKGFSFNFGQSAYPVALMSARMLLDSSAGFPHAPAFPVAATNVPAGTTLDFGAVLVGNSGDKTLTVTNLGVAGSVLEGSLSGASDPFTPSTAMTIDGLESGESLGQIYTYAPTVRGQNNQTVTLTTNGGNVQVVLSGKAVAPVSSLTQSNGYGLVGYSTTASITIQNIGDGNLSGLGDISNLNGSISEGTGAFSGSASEFSLADGASQTFEYSFTPAARGAESVVITASFLNGSSDGANSDHTEDVTLHGTGVAPVLSVDNNGANAGLVRVGSTALASVVVRNTGDGNLSNLGDISNLNGELSAPGGSFIGNGGAFSLPDNQAATFDFTFAPTTRGYQIADVVIQFSNGSANGANNAGTVSVEVEGQGVGPVYFTDVAPGSTLDFGTVPEASAMTLWMTLRNDSTDANNGNSLLTDLTILNAEITGPDVSLFSIVGLAPGTILHQSDMLVFGVSYNGTGEHGERSAWLTLVTDEGAAFGSGGNIFQYEIKATLAPEPGTLVLLGMGGLLLGAFAWRRRRAGAAR